MRPVNLLPVDARVQTKRLSVGSSLAPTRILQGGGIALALVVLLLGGLYMHSRSVVHSKQNRLNATQAQLAAVQARVAKVEAMKRLAEARFAVVKSIVTTRMNWDGTLLDLAKVVPSGVYLTSLTAAAGTSSSVATTSAPVSTFTISGSAPSYVTTAQVLDRLALLPWLTNIQLQTTARQQDGTVTFTIQGTVTSGGAR